MLPDTANIVFFLFSFIIINIILNFYFLFLIVRRSERSFFVKKRFSLLRPKPTKQQHTFLHNNSYNQA
jgi:hypothetical protein